jgi:hypothetical protein
MCASRRPTANKRKSHKRGKNPGSDDSEGEASSTEAGPSRSKVEITHQNLSRWQLRIYQAKHCQTLQARMPVSYCNSYCNVVFSSSCGVGMRYGKKLSEFGVPRGSTAWRIRGPPMAVTETGRQYLAILSQPHSCSASRCICEPFPLLAIAGLSRPLLTPGNMLLCSICVPYLISARNPYRILGDYDSYCDRRIQCHPVCGSTVTLVYHCILVWVLNMSVSQWPRCKRRTRTNKNNGRGKAASPFLATHALMSRLD